MSLFSCILVRTMYSRDYIVDPTLLRFAREVVFMANAMRWVVCDGMEINVMVMS